MEQQQARTINNSTATSKKGEQPMAQQEKLFKNGTATSKNKH
jgi:hypothetical protein